MYLWQLQGDGRLKNKHYGHKWDYGEKRWTILNPEVEFFHIKEESGEVLGVNSMSREKEIKSKKLDKRLQQHRHS